MTEPPAARLAQLDEDLRTMRSPDVEDFKAKEQAIDRVFDVHLPWLRERSEELEKRADCCRECFEEFHYDDVGGYNPPCPCHGLCDHCCYEATEEEEGWADDDDGYYEVVA